MQLLFSLDTSKHFELHSRIQMKKQEIQETQEACLDSLYTTNFLLPKAVIQCCIYQYI